MNTDSAFALDRLTLFEASCDPQLKRADLAVLLNIWLDARWTPRTMHLGGHSIHLTPAQVLVSQVRYAKRLGCCPKTLAASLVRLSKAGWLRLNYTPAGTIVTCLADPRAQDT